MACKLDVDLIVSRVVEKNIKNISKIENYNIARTTHSFNKKDSESIAKLNKQWGEKVITYNPSTESDISGTITISISDALYNKYIKAID